MYTNVTKQHTEMKYKLHIYMQARERAVVGSTRLVVVVVVVVLALFPDKDDVGIGGIGHGQSGVGIIGGGGVGRQGKRE